MADFARIDAARTWELVTVEWSVLGGYRGNEPGGLGGGVKWKRSMGVKETQCLENLR